MQVSRASHPLLSKAGGAEKNVPLMKVEQTVNHVTGYYLIHEHLPRCAYLVWPIKKGYSKVAESLPSCA
jgi:hypothetical protein